MIVYVARNISKRVRERHVLYVAAFVSGKGRTTYIDFISIAAGRVP